MEEKEELVKTFISKDEEGNDIEFEVLFTFEDNAKHYMVYTDNTQDDNENTRVYASTFNPDEDEQTMMPIETEEEWETIEGVIAKFQAEAEEGENEQ